MDKLWTFKTQKRLYCYIAVLFCVVYSLQDRIVALMYNVIFINGSLTKTKSKKKNFEQKKFTQINKKRKNKKKKNEKIL